MKYTKNNIDGLCFKHKDSNTLYTIKGVSDNKATICWNYKHTSTYTVNQVLKYIEEGTWIVINSNTKNTKLYEIY